MRARLLPLIVGCVLGVVGLKTATAAEADGQDMANTRSSIDNANQSKNNASGGDVVLGGRDNAPSSSNSSSNDSNNHSGGDTAAPTRRVNIGWQSLLPGSIQ